MTIAFSNVDFNKWEHFTSFITPNDILIQDNVILYTSSGGLVEYNIYENTFNHIDKNNLLLLDLNNITIFKNDYIITGKGPSESKLQILDDKMVLKENYSISESINEIIHIGYLDTLVFVTYRIQNDYGIMQFSFEDNEYHYNDYYEIFPVPISKISDFDIVGESIVITTPEGLLKANIYDNLKSPANWTVYNTPFETLQYHERNDIIYLGGYDNNVIQSIENNWSNLNLDFNESIIDDSLEIEIIDIIQYDNSILFLTKKEVIIIGDTDLKFEIPIDSEFTCVDFNNNIIVLGVKNNGILKYDFFSGEFDFLKPNSPFFNQYDAITTLTNGSLVGVANRIEFIENSRHNILAGVTLFQNGNYYNYISKKSIENYEIILNDQNTYNSIIDYFPGDNNTWSVVSKIDNEIFFSNSGIWPDQDNEKGGLISLNLNDASIEIFDTTSSILSGLNGIYNNSWINPYLTVNQLYIDETKNLWVINPYGESDTSIAVVRSQNDKWTKIYPNDIESFYPTEVIVDQNKLAWFAFHNQSYHISNNNINNYSNGGVQVLDYNNIIDGQDDEWLTIINKEVLPSFSNGTNCSVFSIASDKQNKIWLLTSVGIQGYLYYKSGSNITLIPMYIDNNQNLINYLSNLSFQEGDCIKVDPNDNIWVTTQDDGVYLILKDSSPLDDHIKISISNSEILSNKIYDISIDEINGKVYFSTEKGISFSSFPIELVESNNNNSVKISPNPLLIPYGNVQISNIYPGSKVKIFDINGNLKAILTNTILGENDTMFLWDGKNKDGEYVGSGIYLVSTYHEVGGSNIAKIAVINNN